MPQIVPGKEDAVSSHEMMRSYNSDEGESMVIPSTVDDRFDKQFAELEPDVSNNSSKLSVLRFYLYLTYIILHADSLLFFSSLQTNLSCLILRGRDSEENEDSFDNIANSPILYDSINEEGNLER